MHGKIYHQTIFFPHLLPSFLVSFFSKFPLFPLIFIFPPPPTPNPFPPLFLHITFLLFLSIVIFSFPTSLPKIYTSLFCFISQYEGHDSTFRASCSPPNCTHSLMRSDNSYLNMSRAETKKQAFQNPAISIGFHFLNISTAVLLKHFSFSSSLCTKWKRNTEAMPEHPPV